MSRPSAEFLRECFDYSEGVLRWKVRPESHFQKAADQMAFNTKSAGKLAGKRGKKGYIQVGLRVGGDAISMAAHRIVWVLHRGVWPTLHLDHINRIRDDNRIENLREVTPAQNNKNSARKRVHPYVESYPHGRFAAQTNIGGQKCVHLGIFDTEAEAVFYRDTVNEELAKLACSLAKKTPRPAEYRSRKSAQTFPHDSPMDSEPTK